MKGLRPSKKRMEEYGIIEVEKTNSEKLCAGIAIKISSNPIGQSYKSPSNKSQLLQVQVLPISRSVISTIQSPSSLSLTESSKSKS
jgi:hypothetical protein